MKIRGDVDAAVGVDVTRSWCNLEMVRGVKASEDIQLRARAVLRFSASLVPLL